MRVTIGGWCRTLRSVIIMSQISQCTASYKKIIKSCTLRIIKQDLRNCHTTLFGAVLNRRLLL